MRKLSRRTLLRGGASLAIALPWLEASGAGEVRAAEETPLRFVVVFHANGVQPGEWFPGQMGRSFELKSSLAPLAGYRERMLVVKGIHNQSAKAQSGNPHSKAAPHLLTGAPHIEGQFTKGGGGGFASSISFDQELASRIQGTSPIPSLLTGASVGLGDNGETCRGRISYAGYNKPLTPADKPSAVLQKLLAFSGSPGGGSDPTEIARLNAERRSVLDLAARDVEALLPRLGSADRARLDEHLTRLRELERSIVDPGADAARDCDAPAVQDGSAVPAATAAMFKLIAFALRCDLTRVATFQWSGSQSTIDYASFVPGVRSAAHHQISHDGPIDDMGLIARWHSEKLVTLLDELDASSEGSTTLLDNTIVLYVNDLSDGKSHSFDNLPIVLLGGTGKLATGQALDFAGRSQNDLFITLARAYGIDLTSFGDERHVRGALSGLLV